MTVHGSKGLEFKHVFIPDLVDRKFPPDKRREPIEIPEKLLNLSLGEGDEHLQEERRLFYVAMTRAKQGLYFYSAQNFDIATGDMFASVQGAISGFMGQMWNLFQQGVSSLITGVLEAVKVAVQLLMGGLIALINAAQWALETAIEYFEWIIYFVLSTSHSIFRWPLSCYL